MLGKHIPQVGEPQVGAGTSRRRASSASGSSCCYRRGPLRHSQAVVDDRPSDGDGLKVEPESKSLLVKYVHWCSKALMQRFFMEP